jgi:acyl-coenzyme A synthetase/AMP-(fatty) acid ligase
MIAPGDFVCDWLAFHAQQTPDAPCVGTPSGGWLSYGEVYERVRTLAATLAALGVGPGSRVVLALPSVPATVVASLAVQSLGAAAVEMDRERGEASLAAVAARVQAPVAFIAGRDAALWSRVPAPAHLVVVHPQQPPPRMVELLGPRLVAWLREDGTLGDASAPRSHDVPRVTRDASAMAQLVFTSGTTAQPRGVVQTHRNLAANARSIVEYLGLAPDDRALLVLPLFYVYGKSVLNTHLLVGAAVFLDDRFMYPGVVLDALAQQGCTNFAGVPTTYELLRRQVDFSARRFPSLRFVTQAGGAMSQDTIAWARATFAPARVFVMYGQTEATARLAYLPPELAVEKRGTVGRAIPGVELRVVDESGRPLPAGETGHLVAKGDNVMPGYFEDDAATAEVLHDGWLWTGDLASQDTDGFVTIRGRAKEMLKLGGHRVSPTELEAALAAHPAVLDAAVVGAPDQVGGEAAHAFVVLKPSVDATESELLRHLRGTLPSWKVPRAVTFLDALPLTSAGKVARQVLRERAKAP